MSETIRIREYAFLGRDISSAVEEAIKVANLTDRRVGFGFNGVEVEVLRQSKPQLILRDWWRAMEGCISGIVGPVPAPLLTEEEQANDERVRAGNKARADKAHEEYQAKEAAEKADRDKQLAVAPAMTRDEVKWAEGIAAQEGEPYDLAVFEYAEIWARLMQAEIAKGAKLADIASRTSEVADKGIGISGFMYGCAVNALAECWVYGEDLRRWHNAAYGVTDDQAGTVNPAILTISDPAA